MLQSQGKNKFNSWCFSDLLKDTDLPQISNTSFSGMLPKTNFYVPVIHLRATIHDWHKPNVDFKYAYPTAHKYRWRTYISSLNLICKSMADQWQTENEQFWIWIWSKMVQITFAFSLSRSIGQRWGRLSNNKFDITYAKVIKPIPRTPSRSLPHLTSPEISPLK